MFELHEKQATDGSGTAVTMQYIDARRMTGPNLFWNRPGAILDVSCTADEADLLVPFCESRLRDMLLAVGWGGEAIRHIRLAGGLSVAFTAPIDALYAATAIHEWVWACCDAKFNGAEDVDFEPSVLQIKDAIAAEANTRLIELSRTASRKGVSLLWDDDEVSIGHGSGSQTWPVQELPGTGELEWNRYHDIPVGIVTGTNGKTTTVRIARHVLRTARRNVGLSCTDWVSVNDRIIDRDDWSGPGGARLVLRQPDVDVAILETARGGLLRRGLGVNHADAALITNIAEDHLGDFGSQNLQELLNIKWIVSRAVETGGCLILNADDQRLVEKASDFSGRIVWFSLDEKNPVIDNHLNDGGSAYLQSSGQLLRVSNSQRDTICAVTDIPLTLDGAALHNVANCLGAAALTAELGMTTEQIRAGLCSMQQDANPGRSNVYSVAGYKVLVDFAHNPQAMQALFAMAQALPARRRALCFGQAGDRTDQQIRDLARSAWSIGIDLAIVSELREYARGREPGEVFEIIRNELIDCGAEPRQILHYETESESFDAGLDWAERGDLVVLLDLGRNSNIAGKIRARSEVISK